MKVFPRKFFRAVQAAMSPDVREDARETAPDFYQAQHELGLTWERKGMYQTVELNCHVWACM
jgi:hypothetical protein